MRRVVPSISVGSGNILGCKSPKTCAAIGVEEAKGPRGAKDQATGLTYIGMWSKTEAPPQDGVAAP